MKKNLIVFIILSIFVSINLYGQKQPVWISKPSEVYNENIYRVAKGEGLSAKEAENNAFSSLATSFRLKVKTDSSERYMAIEGVSETVSFEDNISVEAEHDLINVRIAESYYDAKEKKYYALAVMNIKETVPCNS